MSVRRIHFHINSRKPEAASVYDSLAARLPAYGMELCAKGGDADVIIALGGDGTILRAARLHPEKPIAGFNLGGLGYLASVERRDFDGALEMLAEGRFRISERTMLEARFAGADSSAAVALNDIVLTRELSGHAALLDLAVDGHGVARYLADGLVFATPTGSTAYSLAAGGPVLMPDSGGFVVTPMNPHALGMRPMVVRDTVRISATARSRDDGSADKIGVYADGENVAMLDVGDTIEIAKAPQSACRVEFEGHDPYEVLARKLGWRGSMVQ